MNDLTDELAESRETIRALVDSYREAIGVPPSEHQARRLEEMAQRLEAAEAEVERRGRLIAAARRWILNGVDPAAVGFGRKERMLDALAPGATDEPPVFDGARRFAQKERTH